MNSKQILENFWEMMKTNNFYAVSESLHEDYVLEWPQSGERIRGQENFAEMNTYYPAEGKWQFTVNQIVAEADLVVTDVTVTDGSRTDRAITFSTVRDGKIWRQVEFWPEPFEAPAWRAQWAERF